MPRPSAASDPREEYSFRLRKISFRTDVHWWGPACLSVPTSQGYRCWYPSVSLSCFYDPDKVGSDWDGVPFCRSASAPFLGITNTVGTPANPSAKPGSTYLSSALSHCPGGSLGPGEPRVSQGSQHPAAVSQEPLQACRREKLWG